MGHSTIAHKVSPAALLVALGIIFGDIGTSPLYVLKAIAGDQPINADIILGAVSCIFWTLTLQTTFKYVFLVLRADNKGTGGIFSLYALVRRTKAKWLLVPAIVGGATLISDGIITPAISVSSAVEGLRLIKPDIPTIPIVVAIITALFTIQQFGTVGVGKLFGPVMLIWFSMLAVLGISQLIDNIVVLKAINPWYAYNLLSNHEGGFLLLSAVFLCTTGAEALYSDLGHCGKNNIRISWIFVKVSLLLNYFGQSAWMISHEGLALNAFPGGNPFFSIMPDWFLAIGIFTATCATVVASQAMISGSFSLINEAIRLNLWPKVKVVYPTLLQGQLYIPSTNWILWAGCLMIVFYFGDSSRMEAAYGLAIINTFLMTTILFAFYMFLKRYNKFFIGIFLCTYLVVELTFYYVNMHKFAEGGWVTILISLLLVVTMWVWYESRKIKNRYVEFVNLKDYMDLLIELSQDLSIPKYATHLVYLTSANKKDEIEQKVIYSIMQKQPKRADIYWFVHVDVLNEPYTMDYVVTHLAGNDVIRIDFRLGFRVIPRINLLFRKVVQDLVKHAEVDIKSRYESLNKANVIGDFKFVVLEKFLSNENELRPYEKLILKGYFLLKELSLSEERAFGLDTSTVTVEKVPLIIAPVSEINLRRIG